MAASGVLAGAIVMEVLHKNNYMHWSVLVKNYLLAQDLWDPVEATAEPAKGEDQDSDDRLKTWRKKNAATLHTIQISCGPEAFLLIRDMTSAKIAWDTLAERLTPQPLLPCNSPVQSANSSNNPGHDTTVDDFHRYQPFFNAVRSGDWNKAKEFLTLHPNAIRARIPNTKKTALYMAIELQHEHIVEGLVELMAEEDLEIKALGWTALAVAANRGNLKMVECMVKKSKNILSIAIEEGNMTPILLACLNEHWEIVHYLYSVTPLDDLMPEKGPYGAGLVCHSMFVRKFDIAQELIQSCPQLVRTKDPHGVSPIHAFALMATAFPSGTRLKFWQQWIYNCIHIETTRAIGDVHLSVHNEANEEGNRRDSTWSEVVARRLRIAVVKRKGVVVGI
ncbi:hypothetical protein L3X38_011751 [Prunus dulcis]|uniref:DUF4219 domain-containing protein n=1 Tax=Prunus dulcis TaxID=3755 RepID=A0AAD4WI53_PRUDU|nr:hypothetical protein L3X38_011751 [Prunus dulcis]